MNPDRRHLVLSLLLPVMVGLALAFRLVRLQESAAARANAVAAWVRASDAQRARWEGRPDPVGGAPGLSASRAEWDDCRDRLAEADCRSASADAAAWPPAEGAQAWDVVEQWGTDRARSAWYDVLDLALVWGPDPQARAGSDEIEDAALLRALRLDAGPIHGEAPARSARTPLSVELARAALLPSFVHPRDRGAVELVGSLRRGDDLPERSWHEVGTSGLLALEAGAAGRVDLLPTLLAVAVEGPSPADRLAALYAALRLSPVSEWPVDDPATARAAAVAQAGPRRSEPTGTW